MSKNLGMRASDMCGWIHTDVHFPLYVRSKLLKNYKKKGIAKCLQELALSNSKTCFVLEYWWEKNKNLKIRSLFQNTSLTYFIYIFFLNIAFWKQVSWVMISGKTSWCITAFLTPDDQYFQGVLLILSWNKLSIIDIKSTGDFETKFLIVRFLFWSLLEAVLPLGWNLFWEGWFLQIPSPLLYFNKFQFNWSTLYYHPRNDTCGILNIHHNNVNEQHSLHSKVIKIHNMTWKRMAHNIHLLHNTVLPSPPHKRKTMWEQQQKWQHGKLFTMVKFHRIMTRMGFPEQLHQTKTVKENKDQLF